MSEVLAPCPRCGKREGTLKDTGRSKFRYYAICAACQWMTPISRTEGIALKLWNDAKPASAPKQSKTKR